MQKGSAWLFENQGAEKSGYVTDEFLTRRAEEVEGLDTGRWQQERKKSYDEELASVKQRNCSSYGRSASGAWRTWRP
jgi:hypothetical protein